VKNASTFQLHHIADIRKLGSLEEHEHFFDIDLLFAETEKGFRFEGTTMLERINLPSFLIVRLLFPERPATTLDSVFRFLSILGRPSLRVFL
jgi:hypothetical protein